MDMLSLLTGLGIGLVVVLLVWINLNKKEETNRGQLQESALRLKMLEEQAQRAESERVAAASKAEQKQLEIQDLLSENAGLTSTLEFSREQLKKSQTELNEIKSLLQVHQKEAGDLRQSLTGFQEQNRYLLEKQESLKKEFEDIRRQSQLEFQNLAQKILEEKSLKFTAANKENIDNILKPLGENLDHFRKKIEETYDKESKQRFSLEEKIKDLVELNLKLSQEANNLATALKGQSKKQGNWGEIILESILERSGLQKDREYKVQVSIQSEEGKRLQPDVMVYLPEGRTILIDSKVSLVAYDRFSSAENKELQEAALKEHVASMYKHIDDLGDKRYDRVAGSFDFTMMFVPIEPAYLVALQAEPELWAYAYAKRILLISPTNLIASLRLIADLWKREQQNKNAQEIAKYGERLYDKIVLFLESMDEVGRFLNKSQDSYLRAVGQLKDGRGSLVKQAQRLRSLGLNPQKDIPATMLPLEDDFPEDTVDEAVNGE